MSHITYNNTTRKRICYEDDVVEVYNKKGECIYYGLEDYEPMKREDWRWDEKKGGYTYGEYKKVLVGESGEDW